MFVIATRHSHLLLQVGAHSVAVQGPHGGFGGTLFAAHHKERVTSDGVSVVVTLLLEF